MNTGSSFYRVQELGADAAVVTPAGRVIGKFFGPEGLRHARNFCASINKASDAKMAEIMEEHGLKSFNRIGE